MLMQMKQDKKSIDKGQLTLDEVLEKALVKLWTRQFRLRLTFELLLYLLL
jgi:hypothetical protein